MEAMKAASSASDPVVPRVHLHATHESALDKIDMGALKKYAAEQEAANASSVAQGPGGLGGAVRESRELSGKESMTSRESESGPLGTK
jgi:hypothetical protein